MFTEIGDEGLACCPYVGFLDFLIKKAGFLVCLKPSRKAEIRDFLPEDSGLSKWHLDLAQDSLKTLGLARNKQRLTREDLITVLQLLGHCPNLDYLEQILEELGIDGKDSFTYGDLCCIWRKFIDNHDDEVKLLQKAFQFFDKDNDGSLSIDEFQIANRELGNLLTDDEIKQFVELVDVTQDGNIQYEELLISLMAQYTRVLNQLELAASSSDAPLPHSTLTQRFSNIVGSFKQVLPANSRMEMLRDRQPGTSSGNGEMASPYSSELYQQGSPQIGTGARIPSKKKKKKSRQLCGPSLKALLAEPEPEDDDDDDGSEHYVLTPAEEDGEVDPDIEPSYPSHVHGGSANNESDSRNLSMRTDKLPSSDCIEPKSTGGL